MLQLPLFSCRFVGGMHILLQALCKRLFPQEFANTARASALKPRAGCASTCDCRYVTIP